MFARLSSRVLTPFRFLNPSVVPVSSMTSPLLQFFSSSFPLEPITNQYAARSFTMASDPSTYKLNRVSPSSRHILHFLPIPMLLPFRPVETNKHVL